MSAPEPIHPIRRWAVFALDLIGILILFGMAVGAGLVVALLLYTLVTPSNWPIAGAIMIVGVVGGVLHLIGMSIFKGADWLLGRPFHKLGEKFHNWSKVTPTGPHVQRFARWVLGAGFLVGAIGIPLLGYIRSELNI